MMMMARLLTKEERATAIAYLREQGVKVRNDMGNAALSALYHQHMLIAKVTEGWGTGEIPTKAQLVEYLRKNNVIANNRMDEERVRMVFVEYKAFLAEEQAAQAQLAVTKEKDVPAAQSMIEEAHKEVSHKIAAMVAAGISVPTDITLADLNTMYAKYEAGELKPDIMLEEEAAAKQKQIEEEKPKMTATKTFTKEELSALFDEVKAPLYQQITELSARLEEWEKATIGKPSEQIEVVDPRSEFEIAFANYKGSFDAYMTALRMNSKGVTELKARCEKDRAIVKAMEKDQRFALVIADVIQSFSNGTREYGHHGVNVIANVLHIGVDAAANLIQATAKGIAKIKLPEKKDKGANVVPFPKN